MTGWERWECPQHGVYGRDWTVDQAPKGICWTVIKCRPNCDRGKDCVYCGHKFVDGRES